MMTLPPVEVGAVKLTVTCVLPANAVAMVGGLGIVVDGVTLLEPADGGPEPTELVAMTTNV